MPGEFGHSTRPFFEIDARVGGDAAHLQRPESDSLARRFGFSLEPRAWLQNDHCVEFMLRREAMAAADIIRSATLVNAEILRQEGRLGELVPGAFADLLVVDGDPFRDISVLLGDGGSMPAIMLNGRFVKNEL